MRVGERHLAGLRGPQWCAGSGLEKGGRGGPVGGAATGGELGLVEGDIAASNVHADIKEGATVAVATSGAVEETTKWIDHHVGAANDLDGLWNKSDGGVDKRSGVAGHVAVEIFTSRRKGRDEGVVLASDGGSLEELPTGGGEGAHESGHVVLGVQRGDDCVKLKSDAHRAGSDGEAEVMVGGEGATGSVRSANGRHSGCVGAICAESQKVERASERGETGGIEATAICDQVDKSALCLGGGEQLGQAAVEGGFAAGEGELGEAAGELTDDGDELVVGE